MEIISGADPLIMERLRRQTERRHPKWFDPRFHPPATAQELHKVRMETDRERGIKQGLGGRRRSS